MTKRPAKGRGSKGRVKGTPNKRSSQVIGKLEELKCDPVEILAHFANGDWEALGYEKEAVTETYYHKTGEVSKEKETFVISPDLRQKAASDLMPYMFPKLKAQTIELGKATQEALNGIWEQKLRESIKRNNEK